MNHRERFGRALEVGLRILLGGVFLSAGLLKIADPSSFAFSLARLQALPRPSLGPLAIVLPWMEAVWGAALLFISPLRMASLRLLLGLLVAFSAVLGLAAARGGGLACGCFGAGLGTFLGRPDVGLARNLLLGAAGIWLLAQERRREARGSLAA